MKDHQFSLHILKRKILFFSRRGTLELDILCQQYYNAHIHQSKNYEQHMQYIQVLQQEDIDLSKFLYAEYKKLPKNLV